MRWLLPVLALMLTASTATAATIRGSVRGELVAGTRSADRIFASAGNDYVQVAFGGLDTVDCGPGTDVVSADAGDRVAANCEVVSRRLGT